MHIEGLTTSVSHPIDKSNQLCVFLFEAVVLGIASSMSMRFFFMKYVDEINEQYSRKRVVDFIGLWDLFFQFTSPYTTCVGYALSTNLPMKCLI
jgi:hypothetical protein